MKDQSYQQKYSYGTIVRFTTMGTPRNGIVEKTHGISADTAMVHLLEGWVMPEKAVRPLTRLEFFYWLDPVTGMHRIGLMGWVESIVIPLATLGIFAMSFTPMSAPWAWMVRGLAGVMAGAVIGYTIKEHRKMYRKPSPRTA